MGETDLALIAHLMRRAGFGATRTELEQYSAKSYEDIVEDLLHPDRCPDVDDDEAIANSMIRLMDRSRILEKINQ